MQRTIDEYQLWGWDDGGVFFARRSLDRVYCVTDDKELIRTLKQGCLDHLHRRGLIDESGDVREGKVDAS